MNKAKVVILGGGIGGIVTANHLGKLLPHQLKKLVHLLNFNAYIIRKESMEG